MAFDFGMSRIDNGMIKNQNSVLDFIGRVVVMCF